MEKIIETVGELFEIVKSLLAAQKARGEAIDKAIGERLAKAEQALYDARKSVQKVKLACAESAERLAGAYRAPGAPLAKLDDAMAERSALCSDARYHAVEIGADDVASLIKKIGAIAPQK